MAERTAADWDESIDVSDQNVSFFVRGMRTLWKLAESKHREIKIAVALLAVVEVFSVGFPFFAGKLIDQVPSMGSGGFTAYAWLLAALMVLCSVAELTLRHFVVSPLLHRIVIFLENHWPMVCQEKLLALSLSYHDRENTGKKIAKVNKGVEKLINTLYDTFWVFLPCLLYLAVSMPLMIVADWKMGAMFVLPLAPFVVLNLYCYRRFYPRWELWERLKEEAVGLFCQSILNIRTTQAYVAERREIAKHGRVREEMREVDVDTCIHLEKYFYCMNMLLVGNFGVTIIAGIYFVNKGWSTFGALTYVFVTGIATMRNMWHIIGSYTKALKNLVAAERMQQLLDEPISVANEFAGFELEDPDVDLVLDEVSHVYPGKENPVLHRVSLAVRPGSMLALVGRSGSGKSTIVNLLRRVLDPTGGQVRLGETNVGHLDRDWYRSLFAVVTQDSEVYEGTLLENVTLGHPRATRVMAERAIRMACLKETLADKEQFPDGIDTKVGERGVQLSGGQKQRLVIARACLAIFLGARILVLDEATSSVDSEAERAFQSFLGELREEYPLRVIAIAHRLSTIYGADEICVIEKGRVVESGDHDKLMRRNGLYSRLVELQNMNEVRAT